MGPRSYERGKGTYDEAGDVVGMVLQWSRVPLNAESARLERQARGRCHASTGPRSFERGRASSSSAIERSLRRFNGAAFLRTRNGLPTDWVQLLGDHASMGPRSHAAAANGFNGAAFLRTRKGTSKHRLTIQLQWGRVPSNAEGVLS